MKIYKRKMYCEPLTSNPKNKKLIENFHIEREKGISDPFNINQVVGLEDYLKKRAWRDDLNGEIRVYVIKTYITNEVVAYFSLKSGMILVDSDMRNVSKEQIAKANGIKLVPSTISGIELAHFAVNDNYRNSCSKDGKVVKGLGAYLYPNFIFPYVKKASSLIGTKVFYLYSVDDGGLADYYNREFGFTKSDSKSLIPVKPYYDNGCEFMYQLL